MPCIICPHCLKRELVPLAICESWAVDAEVQLTNDAPLWFLNCDTCEKTSVEYMYMRIGVGTQIRLHEARWTEFESLNRGENFRDFAHCGVTESHSLRSGFHIYLASNDTGNQAVILDPWVQTGDKTLTVTDCAVAKFSEFLCRANSNHPNYIRLSVNKDESENYVYHLNIDNGTIGEIDWVNDAYGFRIAIDAASWLMVKGTAVDWKVGLDGKAGFKFDKPIGST